jgi:TPP-dependent pyruvate/acetoin dehydrogenase alpha subunit
MSTLASGNTKVTEFIKIVLNDYKIANESREASLMGRREVLTGKAKFGIFGDGKEVAQLAMAKVFRDGDFRSGYYRDQKTTISRCPYSCLFSFSRRPLGG